ncbi:F-box protein At5g07610-like [Cornus florida]|uniref:F-box protein At5g07610-like n=1 Tax=Cornus florida TaxID=4283 RepID=UPI0028A0323D|nr:F-box protein At5g07610-like [Cornus florida]
MASTAAAEVIGDNKELAVEILQYLPAKSLIWFNGNKDPVVEILQYLPAKSLIRFKSVSKAWLSFISPPGFSLLWQSHHHPKVSGLVFNPRSRTETIKYIPLTHSEDLRNQCDIAAVINGGEENSSPPLFRRAMYARIIDSRNGFLLVSFNKKQSCSSDWRRSYHVYDPTTKQFSTLPRPFPVTFTSSLGDNVYLVFDPLKSLHHKVVLVQASEPGSACLIQIHIYSSETNDWWRSPLDDDIGDFHPFPKSLNNSLNSVDLDLNGGVFCNGSIHWFSCYSQKTNLYFDVDQERFRPMPSPPYAACFKWHFGESGGHLHYIRYYDNMGFNVNVSEMESDYSKWTTKYRVCINMTTMVVDLALEEMKMVVCNSITALSLIHGEDEGDVFLVLVVRTKMMNYTIISYNIKENTLKKLGDVSRCHVSWHDRCSWTPHPCIHSYIETLFPV